LSAQENKMSENPSLYLVTREGPLAGQRIHVSNEIVVGRERADVIINITSVAPRHAAIRPAEDGLEVEDLGSTTGTFVNGHRIEAPTRVQVGDIVGVGQTQFEVHQDWRAAAASAREGLRSNDILAALAELREEKEAEADQEEEAATRPKRGRGRRRAEEKRRAQEEKQRAEELARDAARKQAEEAQRAAEEQARKRAEEEARARAEEEARARAEEEAARKQAEEEARARAEEEARARAEEEARLRAEEEARKQAEEEARARAEEARKQAEEEAARKQAEEQARARAEEEARKQAEEEAARKQAEEQARARTEEEARKQAEQEAARKQAEEQARARAEEEARQRAEEKKRAEETTRERAIREAEEQRRAEEEARRRAAAVPTPEESTQEIAPPDTEAPAPEPEVPVTSAARHPDSISYEELIEQEELGAQEEAEKGEPPPPEPIPAEVLPARPERKSPVRNWVALGIIVVLVGGLIAAYATFSNGPSEEEFLADMRKVCALSEPPGKPLADISSKQESALRDRVDVLKRIRRQALAGILALEQPETLAGRVKRFVATFRRTNSSLVELENALEAGKRKAIVESRTEVLSNARVGNTRATKLGTPKCGGLGII